VSVRRFSPGSSRWRLAHAWRSVVIVLTSFCGHERFGAVLSQSGPACSGRLIGMSHANLTADALVVVDVQRALVTGEHAVADADAYLDRWAAALTSARSAGVPVIHLQDDGTWPGSLIPRGSAGWELVLPVAEGERVIGKARDDGFDGSDLETILRGAGVSRLCLVGIQSEMCVAATARGAMARGPTVLLPRDGHTTYAVPASGAAPAVPAALVSRVAEWSLGDKVVAPDRTSDVRFVGSAISSGG
jgi:nicotinamidase-related amidase